MINSMAHCMCSFPDSLHIFVFRLSLGAVLACCLLDLEQDIYVEQFAYLHIVFVALRYWLHCDSILVVGDVTFLGYVHASFRNESCTCSGALVVVMVDCACVGVTLVEQLYKYEEFVSFDAEVLPDR